ncbi:MAG: DUF2254 domain-containing protein [Phycisphaeraceae bacterium]|nr:MAG: DUF2254 domain-containing protein [Phycisphaeraceae bacterium]
MIERIQFLYNRLLERLWVKPLAMCVFSIGAVYLAKAFERTPLASFAPELTPDSVEKLLTILAGGMLVIATFAVGAMVASYASASRHTTPRALTLVISDDVSQNALSIFIGAFIFSIVSILFHENDFYNDDGQAALLALTVIVFIWVVLTFVRWIDSIARLGLMGATISKVESTAADSLESRRKSPTLGCVPVSHSDNTGAPVGTESIGWVQQVMVSDLQEFAEAQGLRIRVLAVPGAFAGPDTMLAAIIASGRSVTDSHHDAVRKAFRIKGRRTFDEDPHFGLVVLSEIAGKALSPAVNDPGTAVEIICSLVRLFSDWSKPLCESEFAAPIKYDRVEMPELCVEAMFDDAFTAIARDGAGHVEVATRLQEAFRSLATIECPKIRAAAFRHARAALARSEVAMDHPQDLLAARERAAFATLQTGGPEL